MRPNDIEREIRETPGVDANGGGPHLSIVLPHTEVALTAVAMQEAARLARGLDAHVTMLAVRVVPFPEVLDPTRGCPEFEELLAMAETAGVPVTINIVYARDWESACQ
jgi:hypothetical protein